MPELMLILIDKMERKLGINVRWNQTDSDDLSHVCFMIYNFMDRFGIR